MGNFGEDSDDSDGEGGLGNVSRIIMRPPGHSGKAKRGHLCFDASFETGNLGKVDLINDYEYDLYIRPDTCSPRLRFWFNFTVDNVRQDQRVVFNIVNISKEKNLFMDNMTPLVRSSSRPKWQRIPKQFVFYHKSIWHQGHYILSFAFGFDKEEEVFHFCMAPPYSYSRLQTFLNLLEKKAAQFNEDFRREILENSVQRRRMDVLTIGAMTRTVEQKTNKRLIAIMARVHPGESPGSFVCQGLLELLLSSNSVATTLRKHVIFKIIPMLNPDGVFLGNYRSTALGADLNRSWHITNPWSHPTIKAILSMLTAMDKDEELQMDFIVDIHANSSLNGCFIYGNTYNDVYRYERHILLPKLLANTDDYSSDNTMFNSDSNKSGSARRYLCSVLKDAVNCYTFEVSVFGYKLKGSNVIIPYTEESYMKCGRNLIQTIFEYYQNIGVIAVQMPAGIFNKRKRSNTRKIRRRNKNLKSSSRNRVEAQVHYQNFDMKYDSETSGEELIYGYKNLSSHRNLSTFRTFEKISEQLNSRNTNRTDIQKECRSNSPLSKTFVVLPEPSLSIIDFNVISRDDFQKPKWSRVKSK